MFSPIDPVLCFYLLLGQKYIVDNNLQFTQPIAWYENKELITNDNIFNLNDTIPKVIVNDKE